MRIKRAGFYRAFFHGIVFGLGTVFALSSGILPIRAMGQIVVISNKSSMIGGAYASDRQEFIGGECLSGETVPTGSSDSDFKFSQEITETQLANDLGFGLSGRARFGVVEATASADFFSRSVSDSYSLSAIYEAHYNLRPQKVTSTSVNFTTTGTNAKAGSFTHWPETCGDMFVDETRSGGKLFFSIRIDFASQKQKKDFAAHFSVSGPLAGVEGSLKTATEQFSKDVRITVSAFQVGGDVTKITKLFGDSTTARLHYTQCSLGGFEDCAKVVENALSYSTDVTSGFPSQLTTKSDPGPATLAYVLSPYSAYGIYSKPYPHLEQAEELARESLGRAFETAYRQHITATRLLARTLTANRRTILQRTLTLVDSNISTILKASKACYDSAPDCPRVVTEMALASIDPDALQPDSFSTLCVEALASAPTDPLRVTIMALADYVDQGGYPKTALDCKVYGRLLRNVKILRLNSKHISTLEPISGFTGLERLWLDDNDISDISPLEDMHELDFLYLNRNRLSDLKPLAELSELRELSLGGNRIVDASPLSKLQQLISLNLSSNRLSQLGSINGLKRLVFLGAQSNNINSLKDITDLPKLRCIAIGENPVSDTAIFTSQFPTVRLATLNSPETADWSYPCW